MNRLRLFPKIFLYTLLLMLMIALLASGMIYLLAPMMVGEGEVLLENTPGIAPVSVPRNPEITEAILGSLPYTIGICIFASLICAYALSRALTKPIHHILNTTVRMTELEKGAACQVPSHDEIGELSESINLLYQKLLNTIEHLKEEKELVSNTEKQKVEFLRAASHELKTPVTALNAMLENMMMGVGKYQNYDTFLPLCKEQTEQLGKMISQILDASKLSEAVGEEELQKFDFVPYFRQLCSQYELIAGADGLSFHLDLPRQLMVQLPPRMLKKALSNILSNAAAYTDPGGGIWVSIQERTLKIENECVPIPNEHLKHIFEPFYRPDYARNRNDGGNGLGLYITASILKAIKCSYSFAPMEKPVGMRFSIEL